MFLSNSIEMRFVPCKIYKCGALQKLLNPIHELLIYHQVSILNLSIAVSEDSDGNFNPATLKPVLNEIDGFYQIGPALSCNEDFILSVTISFASNLPNVSVS